MKTKNKVSRDVLLLSDGPSFVLRKMGFSLPSTQGRTGSSVLGQDGTVKSFRPDPGPHFPLKRTFLQSGQFLESDPQNAPVLDLQVQIQVMREESTCGGSRDKVAAASSYPAEVESGCRAGGVKMEGASRNQSCTEAEDLRRRK